MLLNHAKPVQATLVGSTMVVAFRNSNPSLVWKYDLERNHSFTLALQGEDGDFELGITSPKGEFTSIARFAAREDADEAFTAVQNILMKKKWSRLRTVLTGVAGLFAIVFFYTFISHLVANGIHLSPDKPDLSPAARGGPAPEGIPLPADQVLQPPS